MVNRFAFHTSSLFSGVYTFTSEKIDVFPHSMLDDKEVRLLIKLTEPSEASFENENL
jgi:hypothetical protein